MNLLPRRLLAGALVGLGGALAFGVAHAILIKPVVPPFVVGALAATPVGAAAAWAWHELRRARPASRGLHVGLALAGVLLPAGLASLALGPFDEFGGGASAAARVALVALPLPLAALLGWMLGRTWRAALALGLAGGLLGAALSAQIATSDLLGRAGAFYAAFLALTVGAGILLERVDARLAR